MTEISAAAVRELRETTGCGMMDCKKALVEAGGDVAKAKELLRQKGLQTAGKKGGRSAGEGVIGVYRHHDLKRAVLVELNCETDFVARNEKFQQLAADFAMHVCATNPEFLNREEVPADIVKKEEELILHSDEVMAKPEAARPKIVEGKLRKFYEQQCLLDQRFVKDDSKTIQDVINDAIANLGENIRLSRFVKFEVGG